MRLVKLLGSAINRLVKCAWVFFIALRMTIYSVWFHKSGREDTKKILRKQEIYEKKAQKTHFLRKKMSETPGMRFFFKNRTPWMQNGWSWKQNRTPRMHGVRSCDKECPKSLDFGHSLLQDRTPWIQDVRFCSKDGTSCIHGVPIKRAAWRKNPSLLHCLNLFYWYISISVAKKEWRIAKDPSPSFTHPSLSFPSKNQKVIWPSEGVKDYFAFI